MKKLMYIVIAVTIFSLGALTEISAQKYIIEKDNSIVRWEGANVVNKTHNGTILLKSGEVELKAGIPVSAMIVIDMNTIVDLDIEAEDNRTRLENHLKSEDFFGVDKFPEAVFKLTKAEKNNGSAFHISGNLTIKGITKPIDFIVRMTNEGNIALLTGHMDIDRSLFDVRYGSGKFFENLGNRAINDLFKLDFELQLKEMK